MQISSPLLKGLHPKKSFSDKENSITNCKEKVSENKSIIKPKKMKIEKTNSTFQKQFDIKDEQINVIKEDPTELDSENKENLKNIINCEYLALQKSFSRNDSSVQSHEKDPIKNIDPYVKKKEKEENKIKTKKTSIFKTFNLLTEKKSKERRTQSFYTPAAINIERKKIISIDKNEFLLQTENRGIKKKIEFEFEIKKNELIEKSTKIFKAQPMPNYFEMKDEFLNKNIKTQKITKPFPITFRTDERAFKSLTKNEALKEEKDNQFFFKAKEAPDFSKKFFNLKPLSLRKSMDFSEFKLLTAKRAEMRSDYENVLKNRKIFEEKRELDFNKQKDEEEKEQLEKLRKDLIFKAQPIKKYQMINLDDKPIKKLTSPKEFKFNETVSKCKHEVQ